LQHEKGYDAKNDIFESLDVTWNRVAEGAAIEKKDHSDPEEISTCRSVCYFK
jgi:hypothetical protein